MTQHDPPRAGRARVAAPRPLSVVLLVVLLAASVAPALVVHQVVRDQEHRLLAERTAEVGQVAASTLTSVGTELAAVGAVAAAAGTGETTFVRSAQPLVRQPGVTVALLRADGAGWQVVRTLGADALGAAGSAVTRPERLAALRAAALPWRPPVTAQAGDVLVPTMVFTQDGRSHVGWALRAGLTAPGYSVFQDQVIAPFAVAARRTQPDQAFADIVVAVYATPTADPAQLLIANTRAVPLTGSVGREVITVGGGRWLLVVKARHPLTGSFATFMPWVLLGLGVLFALLVAVTVEILARRRRYALELVEERTAELRGSLEQLEQTQAQLVRSERLAAIGELASAVGHELRNPLGVLTNALYLLRAKLGADPAPVVRRQLDTADREVAAATLIVSDLLEFARARDPMLVEVDLSALVRETVAVVPPPDGIGVDVAVGADLPHVRADRDQLRQVLLNLVTNAYQAMPEGGRVTIDAERGDGVVHVRVRDTGTGISQEAAARLFEPFFTTKARGVGLGLSVCRRIAEAHGGWLDADSRPGEGATFTLTLPLVTTQRAAPPGARARQPVAP